VSWAAKRLPPVRSLIGEDRCRTSPPDWGESYVRPSRDAEHPGAVRFIMCVHPRVVRRSIGPRGDYVRSHASRATEPRRAAPAAVQRTSRVGPWPLLHRGRATQREGIDPSDVLSAGAECACRVSGRRLCRADVANHRRMFRRVHRRRLLGPLFHGPGDVHSGRCRDRGLPHGERDAIGVPGRREPVRHDSHLDAIGPVITTSERKPGALGASLTGEVRLDEAGPCKPGPTRRYICTTTSTAH
jgi:hypothetical protein